MFGPTAGKWGSGYIVERNKAWVWKQSKFYNGPWNLLSGGVTGPRGRKPAKTQARNLFHLSFSNVNALVDFKLFWCPLRNTFYIISRYTRTDKVAGRTVPWHLPPHTIWHVLWYFLICTIIFLFFFNAGLHPLSGHDLQFKNASSVILFITKVVIFCPVSTKSVFIIT